MVWLTPAFIATGATPAAIDAAVVIQGNSECPSPAEVTGRVSALLAGDAPATVTATAPRPARASVDRAGSDLRVRLTDEGGAPVAERRLPAAGNCTELAEVVAVTIGTWLGQLRPERLEVPRLPHATPQPAQPPAASSVVWEMGAGAETALAEGGLAAGASALLSVHTGERGPGLVARASGTTAREVSVGAHTAAWRRWDVTVGPSYQLPAGAWRLTTSVGFSAGWLSAQGRDFPENQASSRVSPGLAGQVQLAHPFTAWAPWLAVGASAAFLREPLTVTGSSTQRALRPIELDIALGASIKSSP